MRIGLLLIATNEYMRFLPQLLGSMRTCFMRGTRHTIWPYIWTNRPMGANGTTRFQQDHMAWPHMTLRRYEMFWREQATLRECDYLFYCDVDMVFTGQVGEEVLGELVGTLHPGFWDKPPAAFPYEDRPESRAFVRPREGGHYYAGGFNGGTAAEFLQMSECLSKRIQQDLDNGIIARWHDESATNWYFENVKQPTVTLSPAYCFPQARWAAKLPFERKLMALDKPHAKMRT